MDKLDHAIDDVDGDVRRAMAELSGDTQAKDDTTDAGHDAPVNQGNEVDTRTAAEIARDPMGRFARRSSDSKPDAAAKEPTTTAESTPKDQAPPPTSDSNAAGGPPSSWSLKSKAAWDALPADVRADIAKREVEVSQGLKALGDYRELKPYADMAQQNNTTIAKALDHFVRIDTICKQDLGAGLAFIVQNSGRNQQQAAELFASLAEKFGGQSLARQPAPAAPNAVTSHQGDPLHELLQPLIQPLVQKIGTLESSLTQRQQAEQTRQLQTLSQAIEQFSSDPSNRYFPELEGMITRLLESGIVPRTGNPTADLRAAYDMAARAHPEVSQALIEQRLSTEAEAKRKREQEAADKAKAASRSMGGSRVPGAFVSNDPGNDGPDDVEADVRRALRQLSMV